MQSPITKQCNRGHMFEPDPPESNDCPICAQLKNAGGYRPQPTTAIYTESVPHTGQAVPMPTKPVPMSRAKTVSVYADLGEPVVGWLVAISGPMKGRDFRIPIGRSSFGRSASCRIVLDVDDTISGQQGFISYSKNRRFMVSPGEGSALLYLNDIEVLNAMELHERDRLSMGNSEFVFMPFCGTDFDWGEQS